LTFLDLVQLRVVRALRGETLSLQSIREAAETAVDLFDTSHPLASVRLKTDGRRIFSRLLESDADVLVELARPAQSALRADFEESLREISYATETGLANRWYVAGPDGGVVIDPRISFGTPVVVRANVPTHIIREQGRSAPDPERLAQWFQLDAKQVKDALRYEELLAA